MKSVTKFFKAVISTFYETKELKAQMLKKYPNIGK